MAGLVLGAYDEACYSNHAQCEQANNNAPLREKSTCKRESDFDEKDKNASTNKEIQALYGQKDKLEKRKKELQYKVGTYKDTFFCNGQTCYPTKTTCLSKAGGSGPTPANICVPYTKKKKEMEGDLDKVEKQIFIIDLDIKKKKK